MMENENHNAYEKNHFITGGNQMLKENLNKDYLVKSLYRKLALTEIEGKLIQISCSLMEDEVYTIENATRELVEVIYLIEMEREGIMGDIRALEKEDVT